MQTGDRLSYHPEHATDEIARFHQLLPRAQASVADINASFAQHLDDYAKRLMASNWRPANTDMDAQRQHRLEAMAKALRQVDEAAK
jgi:hypothetical protein